MEEIIILGYYTLGYDFRGEFKDEWGRRNPIPTIQETVFCGVLVQNHNCKVEIWLHIDEDLNAVVSMEEVEEFGQEMSVIVKELRGFEEDWEEFLEGQYYGETIEFFFDMDVYDFECHYFLVQNSEWNSYSWKQPFVIQNSCFLD